MWAMRPQRWKRINTTKAAPVRAAFVFGKGDRPVKQNQNRLQMLGAMVIFGTLGPFVRQIDLSSGVLALLRALMAVGVIGAFLIARRKKLCRGAVLRKSLPLLLLSGAAMGINWILLFQAYRYTTIAVATLSYYFAPVLVMLACPLLFREKLHREQVLCFVMATMGLILVIGAVPAEGDTQVLGVLYGLGAAAFYAAVILLNKGIRALPGLERTVWQFLAAIVVLIPYVALSDGLQLQRLTVSGWICLAVVGLVHTGVAYCLYFSALKELRGQETAILSYADPLTALLISVLFLGEPVTPLQLVGAALILGFTLWNEWSAARREKTL